MKTVVYGYEVVYILRPQEKETEKIMTIQIINESDIINLAKILLQLKQQIQMH